MNPLPDQSAFVQPMLNPRDCIHGSLARKCEICERDEEIHRLRTALEQVADVARTLVHAQAIAGDVLKPAFDEEGKP